MDEEIKKRDMRNRNVFYGVRALEDEYFPMAARLIEIGFLGVIVAVLDRVILQRQAELITHEADVALDCFRGHLNLLRHRCAIRMTTCTDDLVDLHHTPHGWTTRACPETTSSRRTDFFGP